MKVKLFDYTGFGSEDPALHAMRTLVFTKNTRLNMETALERTMELDRDELVLELTYMSKTIPSSWEFIDYSFLLTGVSRAFTHQMVRTRTGSYAQQTMRTVDMDGWDYYTGPSANVPDYHNAMDEIAEWYKRLPVSGVKTEDARGILPTNILTNICCKFDLRTLCDLFRKRSSPRVQGEYREAIDLMKSAVLEVHPFADIFFDRTFDRAAAELSEEIQGLGLAEAKRFELIKLIDQMKGSV